MARTPYPPRLRELARRLAQGGGFADVTPRDFVGETDAGLLARRGMDALCLVALEEDARVRIVSYVVDVDGDDLVADEPMCVEFRPLSFPTVPDRAVIVPMFRRAASGAGARNGEVGS